MRGGGLGGGGLGGGGLGGGGLGAPRATVAPRAGGVRIQRLPAAARRRRKVSGSRRGRRHVGAAALPVERRGWRGREPTDSEGRPGSGIRGVGRWRLVRDGAREIALVAAGVARSAAVERRSSSINEGQPSASMHPLEADVRAHPAADRRGVRRPSGARRGHCGRRLKAARTRNGAAGLPAKITAIAHDKGSVLVLATGAARAEFDPAHSISPLHARRSQVATRARRSCLQALVPHPTAQLASCAGQISPTHEQRLARPLVFVVGPLP